MQLRRCRVTSYAFVPRQLCFLLILIMMTKHAPASPGEADYTLDDSFWNEESPVGEVERLLREYRQNQELVRNIGTTYYQIIYPVQLRHHEKMGISTREVNNQKFQGRGYGGDVGTRARGRTGKHFHKTSLLIKAFNHKFKLDLELNTQLLAPNLMQKHFLANGAEQFSKQEIEHCYYHGTMKDYPTAIAAFHTCNGVSGVIQIGNETFIIHPFYGGDLSKHPHVIFEARTKVPKGCANSANIERRTMKSRRTKHVESYTDDWPSISTLKYRREARPTREQHNTTASRRKRDVGEAIKYIETALVIDRGMFEKRNGSTRAEVVHDALQVANIADMYFRRLNTRVSIVYVETWQGQNQASIERGQDITRALINFNDYTTRKLYKIEKDTTQLLTGVSFHGGESGMAVPNTVCTAKSVGISVETHTYEPHLLAGIMAHMIGHNIGLDHDDGREKCYCTDWHGCIMAQTIVGLENVQPYEFSTCSEFDYIDALKAGRGLCLFNKPNELLVHSTCGNGVLDDGEECDCGTLEECHDKDPCCDPITCKLTKAAQCASGECCENCQLKPRGMVCREANNECDLVETCTGVTGSCPPDSYKKNGTPCAQSTGYCFSGQCPTLNLQCEQIWGYGSTAADRECFEHFNSKGSVTGHCGKDNKGHFIKCESENIRCGSLQCQSGNRYPVVSGMDEFYTRTAISIKGSEYECKATSGTVENKRIPPQGLVMDGTPCGDNLICVNQTCTSIFPFIDQVKCPTNRNNEECSNKGDCSNSNKCHCSSGWSGADCSNSVDVTQAPTFSTVNEPAKKEYNMTKKETPYGDNAGNKMKTVILVVMFFMIVIGVFGCFAWTAYCFRKKSPLPKYEPPYQKKPMTKSYPGTSSTNHSQEDISLDVAKMHPFNNVSNFSRGDSQRVLFRQGNHAGSGSLGRYHDHKMQKRSVCSGGEEDQSNSGDDDTVAFIDIAQSQTSKLPEKGILKKHGYGIIGEPKDKWLDDSQSDRMEQLSDGRESVSGGTVADMEYKMKDLNGYHEGIIVALKSAAVARAGSAGGLAGNIDDSRSTHDYEYQTQRTASSEKLHEGDIRRGRDDEGAASCGTIRIRNLEDLIKQLEHHSSKHMSPSGSEDIRSEPEADRHYRTDGEGPPRCRGRISSGGGSGPDEDPRFMYGRYRQGGPPRAIPSHLTHAPHMPYSPHRPLPDDDALYETADHSDHRLRDHIDSESDEFIQAQRQLARWASEDAVPAAVAKDRDYYQSPPDSTSGSDAITAVTARIPVTGTPAAGVGCPRVSDSDDTAQSSSSAAEGGRFPEYAH